MSTTPILDLEEAPPPARPAEGIQGLAISALVGFVIGILLIDKWRALLPQWRLPLASPIMLLPMYYVALAVHELGHLVAAWCAGLRSGGMSIGIFQVTRAGVRIVHERPFTQRRATLRGAHSQQALQ